MVRRPQPHVTEVTRGITQSPQAYRFGRVPPYHEIALCAGRPILSDCRSWRRCAHSKSYRRRVHSSSKNSRYCGVAQQKCTRYFIPWGECEFKRQSESLPQTGYPFHPPEGSVDLSLDVGSRKATLYVSLPAGSANFSTRVIASAVCWTLRSWRKAGKRSDKTNQPATKHGTSSSTEDADFSQKHSRSKRIVPNEEGHSS